MNTFPVDSDTHIARFRELIKRTPTGASIAQGKPRVNKSLLLTEWVKEYRSLVIDRDVDRGSDFQKLLDKGHALPFYSIGGVVMIINLTANILRTHSKQWFYPPSQALTMACFALNFIRCIVAYKESSQINKYAKKHGISDTHAKEIGDIYKELIKSDLDDDEKKQIQALYFDACLRQIVCNGITQSNLIDRIIRFVAAVGSPLCVISAGMAIAAQMKGEQIVPMHKDSSWLAIGSQLFSVAAAACGIPFYIGLVKSTGPKLLSHYRLEKICNKKLAQRDALNSLSLPEVIKHSILTLTKLQQRVRELVIRYLTIFGVFIDLPLLVIWGVLELMGLSQDRDKLQNFKPSIWANDLHTPLIWLFFIEASLNVLNFLFKATWDAKRYYHKRTANQSAFGPQGSTHARSINNAEAQPLLAGGSVQTLASSDKHFGLWTLIHVLKHSKDGDPLLLEVKELTGIKDRELRMLRESLNTPEAYELGAYFLAKNYLNSMDEV